MTYDTDRDIEAEGQRAIPRASLPEATAQPADTRRCNEARNRLWAALEGPGALIGSLEEAVGEACARLASLPEATARAPQPQEKA